MNAPVPDLIHSKGRSYNHGWCGPHGIVAGLREAMDGKPATFLIADHHSAGDKVYQRDVIAYVDGAFWYCGENDDPRGGGSHLLSNEGIEHACAVLAATLYGRARYFEYTHGPLSNVAVFRERGLCAIGIFQCNRPEGHDGECNGEPVKGAASA